MTSIKGTSPQHELNQFVSSRIDSSFVFSVLHTSLVVSEHAQRGNGHNRIHLQQNSLERIAIELRTKKHMNTVYISSTLKYLLQ